MAHRWQVAQLLDEGLPYLEVAKRAHASTTTVTRVAQWLRNGEGGYRLALRRRPRTSRLRIAVPSKGRLREPAIELLHDAGLGPETPSDRALAFPCRNAPVEALLVRADDVPEYVQDGVVDCGITGLDIVRERGADVARARCGSGSARARSRSRCRRSRRSPASRSRAARASRRASRGSRASCCPGRSRSPTCTAPSSSRRGSGSRTRSSTSSRAAARSARTGCARSATLLESEAVLVGPPEPPPAALQLAGVFRSVVEARGARYLMLNAPEDALDGDLRARARGRARRASCRCRSPAWSRCTASSRRRTCGGCCPSSRRPARRRSCSSRVERMLG